ncbi:MAG: Rpn family recombination-promoting nuclease/putative transposase [Bacteroidales bacterium]|nr:Rpn family recombination-promoting nuclease/putative transposase [Bacteroidales bacterium]
MNINATAPCARKKYINPFTDFGFKRLFGTEANKDILIHFLNTIIEDEEPIVDVTYMNPEKLGLRPQDRRAIFDIYCKTKTAYRIVEMEVSLKVLRDNVNIVNTAYKEGRDERSIEIARSLKQEGVSTATIIHCTGLNAEDIEKL